MKQPPYFKLTEVEPQVTLWAALMLMLITVATVIALAGRRPTNDSSTSSQGVQSPAQQQQNLALALQQALAVESQQGRLSISKTRNHIRLTINSQQLFPLYATELSSPGKNLLNRLAHALKMLPYTSYQKIQIEAYAERDSFKAASYPHDNWELSSGQAVSALKYLATTTSFETRLFSAQAYADSSSSSLSKTEAEKITNQSLVINIFLTTHQP